MNNFLFLPRALAAALFDITFSIACGLATASFWLRNNVDETLRARLRSGFILCSVAMLLALCSQAYLLTATMAGSSTFITIHAQFAEVMGSTHAGHTLLLNFGLASLVFILALIRRTNVGTLWLPAALLLLAATRAATGHAASDGDFTFPECVQCIHLLSIAVWSGGVIVAAYFIVPAMLRAGTIEAMTALARKLSRTATVALLLVVLSGIYNSYRDLDGSLAPMASTQWGYLLDIKLVLVGGAILMGLSSRMLLRISGNLTQAQASRFHLMLKIEATVMLLILAVSACLANSPPATSL